MPTRPTSLSHVTSTKGKGELDHSDSKRILVIGGTQFIGRLLVEKLLNAGKEVVILHRKPVHPFGKRVRSLTADRNDAAAVQQAVGSTKFDLVYDFAYDWEFGTTGAQVEAVAHIFDGKIGRYVFMSSVAAYGDGLNHHEGDALAPDDHPDAYSRHKAMSERALFRLYQRTGFPIVTLRPPFVYGPGNPFYREAFFWDRFRAGRAVILPSEGHRLMQFIFVQDLVDLAVRVAESRNMAGHAFNTANPRAITQHELLVELARVAGVNDPELVPIPRDMIYRMGGSIKGTDKLYFGDYYDVPAITQIITKSQRMLGFKPVDFHEGLRSAYETYLKKRQFPKADFTFEDELLTRYSASAKTTRSA